MNCDWEKGEMFTMRTVSDTHAVTTQDAGGLSTAIRTHHRAFAETLDGYTADLEAGTQVRTMQMEGAASRQQNHGTDVLI
jgi:hypothetical protein